MAGNQGGKPEAAQTSADDGAREIESALAKEDLTAARRLVARFLQTSGLTADSLLRVGVNLAQHDLYSEASEVFRRCTKDHPKVFEGFYNLSLAELALQQPQDALGTLARGPQASPPEEFARTYLRGKIELALQQDAEAERDLSAAFAAAPQEENFGLDLGLCYLRQRKYQPAAEAFQKALGFHKNSPYLRLGLALAQYLGGLAADSLETCRALLSLEPDFSPARVMMAFALYSQGRIDEAVKLSAQGFHDPNPFPYLYYIHAASLLKLQSQDYDTIVNDLTLAVQSIPHCILCYLALSKVHRKKGELETATAELETALRLDPTFAEAWYNLALVYDQAGQHVEAQQARREFEKVKAIQANLETEMLRNAFLKALGGDGYPRNKPLTRAHVRGLAATIIPRIPRE
jgi:tetratricopeptide (TPR) repeat protein